MGLRQAGYLLIHITHLMHRRILNMMCIVLLLPIIIMFTVPQPLPAQIRIVPDASWVKIFFESIDELTESTGFKPLRSIELRTGDIELRIWSGFGLTGLRGRIIRRINDRWSSFSLYDPHGTVKVNGKDVKPGFSEEKETYDWAVVWQRLEKAGITEIKDDSEIQHCKQILDGVSYVVEIAKSGYYRTYMLNNPQYRRSENGDRFLRILSILAGSSEAQDENYMPNLPGGEESLVASISGVIPESYVPLGPRRDGSEYKVGDIPGEDSTIRLTPQEGLEQAISLPLSQCQDMPVPLRYFPTPRDFVVQLYILPDGTVTAAKALSGVPLFVDELLKDVSKWRFLPSPVGSSKIRSTIVFIQYRKQWVPFPWLE